jgi:multimeric flavodoxin WrbA
MKVIAFNGSPRENGNTNILLNTVLKEISKEGIKTELIELGKKPLNGCIGCGKCKENKNNKCVITADKLNSYVEKMIEADCIILGSPVYFSDLTSNMKSLIDRSGYVSRANGDFLKRKVGAAVVTARRAGAIHTFDSLNHFFLINHMIVPGSSYWNIGMGLQPGDVSKDEEGITTMQNLGENIAWLLKKVNGK